MFWGLLGSKKTRNMASEFSVFLPKALKTESKNSISADRNEKWPQVVGKGFVIRTVVKILVQRYIANLVKNFVRRKTINRGGL